MAGFFADMAVVAVPLMVVALLLWLHLYLMKISEKCNNWFPVG